MQAQLIMRLLPEVFAAAHQPGSVLDAILAVMEAFHAPDEMLLADLDGRFDPWRAPEAFVRLLASWLALDPYLNAEAEQRQSRGGGVALGIVNLRELTAQVAELGRIRGTQDALLRFLELATGLHGFELREARASSDGNLIPFAAELVAPASARAYRQLVELIVALEKPAFTTVDITYRDLVIQGNKA